MAFRRRLAALCASSILLATGAASGLTPVPSELPSGCGSRVEFDRELVQRLGPDAPVGSVHLSISEQAHRFHLRVQIGSELRELEDASCIELFRASIVIAVAVLMRDRQAPKPEPIAASPPPQTPRQYPRLILTGGVGVSVGTLPNAVPAFELEGQTLWSSWGIALDVRYLLPAEKFASTGQGATLQAWSVGTAAVFRPSRTWQARLGLAAQRLMGSGIGSAAPHDDSVWTAGPTLALGWFPLQRGHFWAGLGTEGQLNVVRGRFQILNYSGMLSDSPYDLYLVPWLAGSGFVRLGAVW